MREDFLHYIWKYKRFDFNHLSTEKGDPVVIKQVGRHNKDAGPDFLNARLQIGNTTWAGNVEIHVNAEDWFKHEHQQDEAYKNIILHVVYEQAEEGPEIPTLVLKDIIEKDVYDQYRTLMESDQWIPCESQIEEVPDLHITNWLERLLVERLQRKKNTIQRTLQQNKNDWESTFYQFLARNFGLKINAEPFELVAKSLPLKILAKHKSNPFQIEALLFGQAGFLNSNFKESYPNQLREEYQFLQQKYQLTPIEPHLWKFMRLRPANFPTVRLAQLAQLIYRSSHLFSKILEIEKVKKLEKLFRVEASEYWETHYRFDKTSPRQSKKLGKSTIHLILINTIAPFLFIYGEHKVQQQYKDQALQLLSQLPPEKNSIIKKWKQLDMPVQSAFDTQGLLQLKNEYCDAKKCLDCAIGNKLLQRN